jgi:gliding motility-associated-like protein
MKKLLLLLVFTLLSTQLLRAQSPVFSKKLFSKYGMGVEKIKATKDGGFIVSAHDVASSSSKKPYPSKFKEDGTLEFSKEIKYNLPLSDNIETLPLSNGNYLFIHGIINSDLIIMTDKNFNVLWSYRADLFAVAKYNFNTAMELKNGNIAIVGECFYGLTRAIPILVITPSGVVTWSKHYKIDTNTPFFVPTSLKESNDGNLLLGAYAVEANGITNNKIKLLKINQTTGDIIFEKEYSSVAKSYEQSKLLYEDKENNVYMVFYSLDSKAQNNKVGIFKADKEGNPLWLKLYGENEKLSTYSLLQKSDGTFIAVTYGSKNRLFFLNINQDGNITSQYVEKADLTGASTACYLNNQQLMVAAPFLDCKSFTSIYLLKRATDGKGHCSVLSNVLVTQAPVVESNYTLKLELISTNPPLPVIKPNPTTLANIVYLKNETTFCQDTVYAKRCVGDSYTVGTSTYAKTGIYKNKFPSFYCDSVVVTKLSFNKDELTTLDTAICEGKSFNFNKKSYSKAGIYQDTLKNSLGCDSIITLKLNTQNLAITISNDVTIGSNEKAQLNATSSVTNVNWQWIPSVTLSCTNCPNPIATPIESTRYTVQAKTNIGCTAEKRVNVEVLLKDCNDVFIPNTFSPNDDGTNDRHNIFAAECVTTIKYYSIYNRWGDLVFENTSFPPNNPDYGWDGKINNQKASNGVYVYKIEVEFKGGKTQIFSGDIFIN